MRKISIAAAVSLGLLTPALALDFLCTDVTQSGRATSGDLVPVNVRPDSKLKIHIDTKVATRSSITWTNTGDPELDDQANRFTAGSRVAERKGEIFATLFAELKTLTAVGTLLISRNGDLWITESTATSDKMVHYIIQARCERK